MINTETESGFKDLELTKAKIIWFRVEFDQTFRKRLTPTFSNKNSEDT